MRSGSEDECGVGDALRGKCFKQVIVQLYGCLFFIEMLSDDMA